jgi:DNA-binding MarR family transcriptional regulator
MAAPDNLGFVLKDISRLMRKRFDERARASGVTVSQWRVLLTLLRYEGSNQGFLADLLEVEPITLCRMIDRLEEAGLVERRRDPSDRRAWLIHMTEKAHPVVEQLRSVADGLLTDARAGLSDAQYDELMAALTIVRANLSNPSEQMQVGHG